MGGEETEEARIIHLQIQEHIHVKRKRNKIELGK